MRILGYIDHPVIKITVFQMDNKRAVKFESGLLEQTYKFRTGDHIENMEDIRRLVDNTFINTVLAEFSQMHRIKDNALGRFLPDEDEDEFDDIL